MRAVTYLNFNGQCEEAFKFYERVLGGRIDHLLRHDLPEVAEYTTPEWRDKVMHAQLSIGDSVIMASDAPNDRYSTPQGIYVSLHLNDVAQAERIFNALAEGGEVTMPIAKTFWAERFGMVTDRYRIPWMINCDASVT